MMSDTEAKPTLAISGSIQGLRRNRIRSLARRVFHSHNISGVFGKSKGCSIFLVSVQKNSDWESSPLTRTLKSPFRNVLMKMATLSRKTMSPHEMQGGNHGCD